MLITLNEAKQWLRIDFNDDDALITSLITTSENLCINTLRKNISDLTDTSITRSAELYALAYLYEHREYADMAKLSSDLRYMLSTERESVF